MYISGAVSTVSAVSLWYTLWFMCIVIFISLHSGELVIAKAMSDSEL